MDWSLSPVELIFLGVAVVVTIPFVILIRYLLKELKNESGEIQQSPDKK